MIEQKCLIFGTPASVSYDAMKGDYKVTSKRAGGEYIVSQEVIEDDEIKDEIKIKLARWIYEQNQLGEVPLITSDTGKAMEGRRNLTVAQRADELFILIGKEHPKLGESIRWFVAGGISASFLTKVLAATESNLLGDNDHITKSPEIEYLFDYLCKDGRLEERNRDRYLITPYGYAYLEGQVTANTKQAFVAMWFSDDVKEVYEKGIEPAIRDAGYEPLIINRKETNNKIDDEIIAEIRKSKFVVADFTSGRVGDTLIARGGVYYEAGFAQGLGLPVIWTCRDDCIGHIHFDTRQYNHIVWKTPKDLHQQLLRRIQATIT